MNGLRHIAVVLAIILFGGGLSAITVIRGPLRASVATGEAPAAWTPTNTFGWWDPSDGANIWTSNANTQIFSMRDKSGNGFHATAQQISTAPSNVTVSARQYAGFYTGLGTLLDHTCTLTNLCQAFVVVKVNETTAQRGIAVFTPNAATAYVEFYANTGSAATSTNWGVFLNAFKTTSYSDTTNFMILVNEADQNTTGTCTNRTYTNTNAVEELTGTRNAGALKRSFGYNNFSGGTTTMTLGEVIAYNRVLSENERTNCIAYLKAKWGTP